MKKTTIGLIEIVEIGGRRLKARIDTGARVSSIDKKIFSRLSLGPVLRTMKIKTTQGSTTRPVIKTWVKIRKKKINAFFNIADRKEMEYSVLIGRNILKHGFLIDTTK